jgi:nucleolar protein 56
MTTTPTICSIILLELGIAALDEGGKVIASKKFDNPVRAYELLKNGRVPEEVDSIIKDLQHCENIIINDDDLHSALQDSGHNVVTMPIEQQEEINKNKAPFAVKCGLAQNESSAIEGLRDFAIKISSMRVKQASERLDLHIIQAISALDELDKTINILAARMREWYGLHFPELDNLIQSLTAYAQIVSSSGSRDNISKQILQATGIQERKAEIIISTAQRSRGGDITSENLGLVKRLADQVIQQSELRDILANQIEAAMETVAPNIKELLTASVGARMIAKAGSLQKLATLPASTMQILGAEKALFRSLKTGANPPKHGMIFQHPLIHAAPKWQRGKIARAVASKVAIAARIDAYRHAEKDPSIAERLNKRISEIQEKHKTPPSDKERFKRSKEHGQRQIAYFEQQREKQTERQMGQPLGKWRRERTRRMKKKNKQTKLGKRPYY